MLSSYGGAGACPGIQLVDSPCQTEEYHNRSEQEQGRGEQLKPFTCKDASARNRHLYSALGY